MKKCPFCGAGEADLEIYNPEQPERVIWVVRCTNCDAYGPSSVLKQRARDAWNERRETTP